MNAEAILTPGGIADQLTRGLSGLGQSFARREDLLYQGQRDRIADDRYNAEMALRQQEQARRDARQALEDQRYQQERQSATKDRNYRIGMEMRQEEDRRSQRQNAQNLDYLRQGVVPAGVPEYQQESPLMSGARGVLSPLGLMDTQAPYTPEGQYAANARNALEAKAAPRPFYGTTPEERAARDAEKARLDEQMQNRAFAARERASTLAALRRELASKEEALAAKIPIQEGEVKDPNAWFESTYSKEEVAADRPTREYGVLVGQVELIRIPFLRTHLGGGAESALRVKTTDKNSLFAYAFGGRGRISIAG